MRFYTTSKLGSKRGYTPEGFLVCYDVPIARTGEMLYAPEELNQPGEPELVGGPDGLIRVLRDPDEVFAAESVASFLGKPTTNDHPPELVTPANFRQYAAGAGLNIRRGDGAQSDLLLADLVFSTAEAIAAIEGGKIEISNGYDADYEQVAPGIARQRNIRGNHIALVDEGRCGARCAIGDSAAALQTTPAAEKALVKDEAPSCRCGGGHHHHDAKPASEQRTPYMPKVKRSAFDRLRAAFATKDEKEFEKEISKVQDDVEEMQEASEQSEAEKKLVDMISQAVAAGVKPLADRIDAIEAKVAAVPTTDNDEETEEQKAAKIAEAAAAAAKAAEAAAAATKDNEALVSFLKEKGLSDEDITAASKLVTDSAEEGDGGTGVPSDVAGSGSGMGGFSDPVYNSGASSMLDEVSEAERDKDKKMTADAAGLAVTFRDVASRAEMLAPGIKLPTYDGKKPRKTMADTICALRRDALKKAFASDDRKAFVAVFDANPDFAKLSCGAVKLMFNGATELAKQANNKSARTTDAVARDTSVRASIGDMNQRAKALWKK